MPIRYSYAAVQQVLAEAHGVVEAAEAHGALAGALCALEGYGVEDWLAEILPDTPGEPAASAVLGGLYEATRAALREGAMGFDLLIPQDDASIEERTRALSLWCNGFLYGLGTTGAADPARLSTDAGEVVRDLTEITRAGVDAADDAQENEAALAELIEFVRVGVQLLFEEAGRWRPAAPPVPPGSVH
ncbi:MAG: UPF0149 family protein [Gammaproteobacteria bacterium]|nr:UPF0149 family protein [Gammaproteobacteria bacterium]